MKTKTILFIALLLALDASTAFAQSVYSVLSTAGMLGTWSKDCSQPPGDDNPKLTLSAPPRGRGSTTFEFGPSGKGTVFTIRNARDLSANRVLLHQYQSDESLLTDLILGKADGKVRIIAERELGTDKTLVRDGVDAATGQETPWLARCP